MQESKAEPEPEDLDELERLQQQELEKSSSLINPQTGKPFNAPQNVNVVVPAHQSTVIIPKVEIESLKHMNRLERKMWAIRKKNLLGNLIDQYVKQAAISTNGKATH